MMEYQALITLDLPGANDEQREIFYQVLREAKWHKLSKLTTAWKAKFQNSVTRSGAIETLKQDMVRAKAASQVRTVQYALQLAPEPLMTKEI
jgi:hypothetical protein